MDSPEKQVKTVALFVTCLVDQIYPEIGIATVNLLRAAGYNVEFPKAQTCCGQPFFNSGYPDDAKLLARRTIEILEPYETVVLPSGSCTTMIRLEYAHLFEDEPIWHKRALEVAKKTFELTEFFSKNNLFSHLVREPELRESELVQQTTYHDSCHMCRGLKLKQEPREGLSNFGLEIVEMEEPDRCCGFGGLFSIKMPEVSNEMTREKLRQAADTGAQLLVTSDPGCLMQMRGFGDEVAFEIEHIAVVLDRRSRE